MIDRWEKRYTLPSLMAQKLLEDLLRKTGTSGKGLLLKYFPETELDDDR